MEERIDVGLGVPIGSVPILEKKKEPTPEEMEGLNFFRGLASQDENFYEATAPFFGTDEAKEEVLNEIATLCLHFTIARLFRYREQGGTPRSIRFKIEVDVEGDMPKADGVEL